MDAVPESQVTSDSPINFEFLGARVLFTVTVRGSQADDDLSPGRDLHASNDHRLNCVSKGRMWNGCVVAKKLLDSRGDLAEVTLEFRELRRVAEESDHAVFDEAG